MAARGARAAAGDAGSRFAPFRDFEADAHLVAAFRRGMAEAGYVEGKNVTIEYHFTNFKPELLPQLRAIWFGAM